MFRSASLFIGTSFTVAVFTIFATSNVDSIVGIPHKIYSMQRILIHIKSRFFVKCEMLTKDPHPTRPTKKSQNTVWNIYVYISMYSNCDIIGNWCFAQTTHFALQRGPKHNIVVNKCLKWILIVFLSKCLRRAFQVSINVCKARYFKAISEST